MTTTRSSSSSSSYLFGLWPALIFHSTRTGLTLCTQLNAQYGTTIIGIQALPLVLLAAISGIIVGSFFVVRKLGLNVIYSTMTVGALVMTVIFGTNIFFSVWGVLQSSVGCTP